jgi:hypothetical protein
MKSSYVVQSAKKSFCIRCHIPVCLLCKENGNNKEPWFYICFACKTVYQVGKGECLWT